MGTYDQDSTRQQVNIITSEAHIKQHKILAKGGTNKASDRWRNGIISQKRDKLFCKPVATINNRAFQSTFSTQLDSMALADNSLNRPSTNF